MPNFISWFGMKTLVRDEDGQMYVNLMSRTMKISVQKELVNYLKNQPLLDYKIN